ncbi:Increased rDNA silencing protein [Agyrium rufum]|nr:Increased rDNA silencing protein [Agyrium rufum]
MPPPPDLQRPQSTRQPTLINGAWKEGSVDASALRGASVAFGPRAVKSHLAPQVFGLPNGALAAAYLANVRRSRSLAERDRVLPEAAGTRNNAGSLRSPQERNPLRPKGTATESTNLHGQASPLRSPSQVAASRAAARLTPISTGCTSARPSPSLKPSECKTDKSVTDTKPFPPTNELVKMFEAKTDTFEEQSEGYRTRPARKVASPVPMQPVSAELAGPMLARPNGDMIQQDDQTSAPLHSTIAPLDRELGVKRMAKTPTESIPSTTMLPVKSFPVVPAPRAKSRAKALQEDQPPEQKSNLTGSSSSSSAYTSATDNLSPGLLPTKPSNSVHSVSIQQLSTATQISPSLSQRQPTLSPPARKQPSLSPSYSLPSPSTRNQTVKLSTDSLANAIVASSLASSRAPSPSRPTVPPRRQSKTRALFYYHDSDHKQTRTPSPSKTMRQTLRAPPKVDPGAEVEKRSSKATHMLKKHPNKHAEGSRKRWRDQIADVERKRYEGVWAANRGILISAEPSSNMVTNLVVREIWSRSHLSNLILGEIWDLVADGGEKGRLELTREQFLVGMWLLDQCLKGRKLPTQVSESVWASVKRLSGIKIPNHR